MECQYTSCRVTCPRCSYIWTYMGTRLNSLRRSQHPVKVPCPRCHMKVIMDIKEAV